jgi:spore coat protein U-like protein
LIAFVLGSGQPASASCTSCACTVATTSLNFGSYVFTEAAPTIAAAPISFLCTSASSAAGSVTISLSSGGGTFTARTMRFGANTLRYNVFLDPTHALIFGDGSDGTSFYNSVRRDGDGLRRNTGGTRSDSTRNVFRRDHGNDLVLMAYAFAAASAIVDDFPSAMRRNDRRR